MYLLERPRTSGWLSWNGATQRCCHCLLANKTTAHRGFRKMGATPKSSRDIDHFGIESLGDPHKQKSNLCKKTKQLPIAIGSHIYHLSSIIIIITTIIIITIISPEVGQRNRAVATINTIWLPQNPLCLLSKPPLWIAICLNTFKSFESNLSEVLTWFLRLCIM